MKILKICFTILCFIAFEAVVLSQTTIPQNTPLEAVGIRARYVDNKVKLHWAPLSITKWNNGKTFGYKVTRYLVGTNGALSNETPMGIVKPVPVSSPEWVSKKELDIYDMIWDALYEVNDSLSYSTKTIGGQLVANDTDMIRFSFGMYAAGLKYDAARMCGLTFEDNSTLVANTKYRYKVEALTSNLTNATKSNKRVMLPIEYGIDYVDIKTTYQNYPDIKANKIKVKFEKSSGKIELGWKYKLGLLADTTELSNYFGGFYIERQRIDSTNFPFKRQTLQPFTSFAENADTLFYTNKVPNLAFAYNYRLVGLSYFDEERNSEPVSISVPELVFNIPQIEEAKNINSSTYQVTWQYYNPINNTPTNIPSSGILKQRLYISKKYDADFNLLIDNIGANLSAIDVSKTSIFNALGADSSKAYYYKLLAFTTSSDTLASNAFQFKTSKKSKPPTPTGLVATKKDVSDPVNYFVDLKWDALANTGYQLFRRIGNDTEKIEISEGIKSVNADVDTLGLKMDYPQITYYLVAFDDNYNPSDTLKIPYTKPSTLAPLSPTIKSYEVNNLDVTLNFELSSSSNVTSYKLYRTRSNEANFSEAQPIYTFTASSGTKSYLDPNLTNGATYIYYIIAFTANGLSSCYEKKVNSDTCLVLAQLVPIKVLSSKKPPILDFKADLNLDFPSANLSWTNPLSADVDRIELFKNETNRALNNANQYTFWKSLNGDAITLTDFDVKYFSTYQYGVRAVYKDGTMSPMSTLSVFLPNKVGCVSGNLVITNQTSIPANTEKIDEACLEIRLKPGFSYKASAALKYNAKIIGN